MSRRLEEFNPLNEGKVSIYSCGPTVYDLAHIGNFRSYIFADLLGRALRLGGYQTNHAVNLTDIDDKTIRGALARNKNASLEDLRNFTEPFIEAFFTDIKALGIASFNHNPRATEYIDEMIALVSKLKERGFAYEQDDSVYFSLEKNEHYGCLSHVDLSNVKSGLRYNTDEYNKEDIRDFVLWKAEKPEENIAFDSPFGRGRPGWHLECSAMIHKTFAGPIDIHTGGVDLLFPHHENEIAQSECAYDDDFVSYWLHCEHLLVEGKKMSKSLGNFYTLRDLQEKGLGNYAMRYLLLSVHYRQKLNFTIEAVGQAQNTLEKIWKGWLRLKEARTVGPDIGPELAENVEASKAEFLGSLQDDLNIAKALAAFHQFLHYNNSVLDKNNNELSAADKNTLISAFEYFDQVLNILSGADESGPEVPQDIMALLEKRNAARSDKDYARADELRDQILAAGFEILDSREGSTLQKKKQ